LINFPPDRHVAAYKTNTGEETPEIEENQSADSQLGAKFYQPRRRQRRQVHVTPEA
jgi:hypothetical protein